MQYRDFFSKSAKFYSESRPTYPHELFDYIVSFTPDRNKAWDCATGSGQAALSLTEYFDNVIATDASAEQLHNAYRHDKIKYHTAKAEDSGIDDNTISLTTCATAAHWLDLDKFYSEVKRVSKHNAVIAIWSYGENDFDDPVCGIINNFAFTDMLDYWPAEARFNWEDKYKTIYFPFEEIEFPEFEMKVKWDFERTIKYLSSWSAVRNYIEKNGKDPVEKVKSEIKEAWQEKESEKEIKWKLFGRFGRIRK